MNQRWDLFRTLLSREIRANYLESFGGLAWALLLPLAQLAIYAFVFTKIFRMRMPDADLIGFVPYLAVAMWPWNAFAEGLSRGTTAITDNAALIGKVALPKEVLVTVAVCAPFAVSFVGYFAVLVVLTLTGTSLNWIGFPLLLLAMAGLLVFTLACALLTSATQVFIRDLQHALGPILMLGFFATPILYGLSLVPEQYHVWYQLNPFTHIVELIRGLLLPGNYRTTFGWIILATTPVLLWLAHRYFSRLSNRFEDFL